MFIGDKDNAYSTGKIDIVLKGTRNSEYLKIDDISDTGTKTLAVTGRLEIYAPAVETVWTRLAKTAKPGDT